MQRLRNILFGSPDRVIATISFILSVVSLAFSVYVYIIPSPLPTYIVLRDLVFVSLLIFIIMNLTIRYFKKDDLVERFRGLIAEQWKSHHHMMHNFRDHYFWDIRNELAGKSTVEPKQIDAGKKNYFENVCRTVLTDTRNLFLDYFAARGFRLGDDLALTVKTIVIAEVAQEIINKIRGEKAELLNRADSYIVTGYRDPNTWGKKPERNEIMQFLYRINEENTAFDEILNKNHSYYFSNDLQKEYHAGRYRNQNPNWQKSYNSVLAVPIRYRRQGDTRATTAYGVLSIDSLNSRKHELFDEKITFHLLAASADILALMFGHLDMLQITSQLMKGD